MNDGDPKRRPPPQPLPDDLTDRDDTVADRTLIVDTDRTAIDRPPRPVPIPESEADTLADERPADESTELDDLKHAARVVLHWTARGGRWLQRRLLRPGWQKLGAGWRYVLEALRWRRFEDSDAYSRRRGQQWRRFREGDPGINELREFDEKYRGETRKRDR